MTVENNDVHNPNRPRSRRRTARTRTTTVPPSLTMRLEETLALTPALSPRRGGSTHRSREFSRPLACISHRIGDDMSIGRQALEALHLPITMKTNSTVNTSQADGEQVVRAKKYQVIKLGVDWHAEHYRVVRMIDGAG